MTCAGRESLGFCQSILLPKTLGATGERADMLKGMLLPSHSSEIDKAQKYLAAVTKENRRISLHVLIFLLSFILKNKTVPCKNNMRTFLAGRRGG